MPVLNCHPVSYPRFSDQSMHPLWKVLASFLRFWLVDLGLHHRRLSRAVFSHSNGGFGHYPRRSQAQTAQFAA